MIILFFRWDHTNFGMLANRNKSVSQRSFVNSLFLDGTMRATLFFGRDLTRRITLLAIAGPVLGATSGGGAYELVFVPHFEG